MLPKNHSELSSKAANALGLPEGYKLYSPFPFAGMDQLSSRQGMQDQKFYYLENFLRIGDGNLRTLWGQGPALYTAASVETILPYFYSYNIGADNYFIVFFIDGTAVQVAYPSGATTVISSVMNTFYNSTLSHQLPVCSQWGSQYLLIANNFSQNGYWVWDGSILYTAGGISPVIDITDGGANYTSAPTVTAFGGSGSGIAVTPTVSQGSVVSLQVTNPGTGYLPGDVVQFAFSGGGSDNSAELTAVLDSGAVGAIVLVAGGSGYTPGTYALGFSGGGGTGAAGTYTVNSSGVVASIDRTAFGSGYTGSPTISFPSGGGTGAAAVAYLSAGTVSSVNIVNGGTNFTSTPTLSFEGGGGTGAVATATLTSGVITGVTITNGGMNYTSAPTVIVEAGVNNAAAATAELMPYGVSGSSMETFLQRVWLPFPNEPGTQNNGGKFQVSAPGSFTDFAITDGGLVYTSSDSFLRAQYINIRQSNGYLYPIGDSSVSVISNVQTSGSPPVTTFNYQNTDPQIGAAWRDSCSLFSKTILFSNPFGIFGLYGGSVTKVSTDIDAIFERAVFPPAAGALTPSSGVANIYNRKVFSQLMTIDDVLNPGTHRNIMIMWDEKNWVIASQNVDLKFITTQEIYSDLTTWGTDGNSIYPLFQTPDPTLKKALISKLYGTDAPIIIKLALGYYLQAIDNSSNSAGVDLTTATTDTEIGSYALPNPISFKSASPMSILWATTAGDVYGVNLGFSLTSLSPDFSIIYLGLGYVYNSGVYGGTPIAGSDGA